MASGDHQAHQWVHEAPRKRVSITMSPTADRRRSSGGPSDHEPHSSDSRHISGRRLSHPPVERHDGRSTPMFLTVPQPDYLRQGHAHNSHGDNAAQGTNTPRRKSILSNRSQHKLSLDSQLSFDPRHSFSIEDGIRKKFSITESLGVVSNFSTKFGNEDNDKSCWMMLKLKLRRQEEEEGNSWQPPYYGTLCPPPLCPTYRQLARTTANLVMGLLSWSLASELLGDVASPGGHLFDLAALVVASYLGARLFALVKVPHLVGMFATGILFRNTGLVDLSEFKEVVTVLREMALVVILIRAGLDMDPPALNRMRTTVPKLALVPWLVECGVVAVTTHFLLDMPWMWGLLLGSIIAAVSPAVLVPYLCRLRMKGFGVSKGIPTLIVAVSGVDDATSVAVFSIIHSIMFSQEPFYKKALLGPLSLLGGIVIGIFWGILSKIFPEKNDPYVVPLRILMLLGGGLAAVLGSRMAGMSPAGPIACVVGAFTCLCCWSRQGWDVQHNPVNTAFEIFWIFFEPILFGVSGTEIVISELEPHIVGLILACLVSGIVIRIGVTILISVGSKLNTKEKIFVSLAWMSKAGVQSALAPAALHSVVHGSEAEKDHAHVVLLAAVLSILLTAPAAATIIALAGPRLLDRTAAPPPPGCDRRPSLRSIALPSDDEEEERGAHNP